LCARGRTRRTSCGTGARRPCRPTSTTQPRCLPLWCVSASGYLAGCGGGAVGVEGAGRSVQPRFASRKRVGRRKGVGAWSVLLTLGSTREGGARRVHAVCNPGAIGLSRANPPGVQQSRTAAGGVQQTDHFVSVQNQNVPPWIERLGRVQGVVTTNRAPKLSPMIKTWLTPNATLYLTGGHPHGD